MMDSAAEALLHRRATDLRRNLVVMYANLLTIEAGQVVMWLIGAAGISVFPMSGRVIHKMGLAEDPQNFLLMHSIGVIICITMLFNHQTRDR